MRGSPTVYQRRSFLTLFCYFLNCSLTEMTLGRDKVVCKGFFSKKPFDFTARGGLFERGLQRRLNKGGCHRRGCLDSSASKVNLEIGQVPPAAGQGREKTSVRVEDSSCFVLSMDLVSWRRGSGSTLQ